MSVKPGKVGGFVLQVLASNSQDQVSFAPTPDCEEYTVAHFFMKLSSWNRFQYLVTVISFLQHLADNRQYLEASAQLFWRKWRCKASQMSQVVVEKSDC